MSARRSQQSLTQNSSSPPSTSKSLANKRRKPTEDNDSFIDDDDHPLPSSKKHTTMLEARKSASKNAKAKALEPVCGICELGDNLLACLSCKTCWHDRCFQDGEALSISHLPNKLICSSCKQQCAVCCEDGYQSSLVGKVADDDSQVLHTCDGCKVAVHRQCIRAHHVGNELESEAFRCDGCQQWDPELVETILAYRPTIFDFVTKEMKDDSISAETAPSLQRWEYLIKWKDRSYRKCSWVAREWLIRSNRSKLQAFAERFDQVPYDDPVFETPAEYCIVDRAINVEFDKRDKKKPVAALIRWRGLDIDESTDETLTEDDRDMLEAVERCLKEDIAIPSPTPAMQKKSRSHALKFDTTKPNDLPCDLTDYQLAGLNWLLFQRQNETGCVLNDECGLGKTVQVITFLNALWMDRHCAPFLIIAPHHSCEHWLREFQMWAPNLKVVFFGGSKEARSLVTSHQLFAGTVMRHSSPVNKSALKVHVVITSHDVLAVEKSALDLHWAEIIVDEVYQPKTNEQQLFQRLAEYSMEHVVLLSNGTLPQTKEDLKLLLDVIDKPREVSRTTLEEMRAALEERMLRRLKSEVTLPPPRFVDVIVPIKMSPKQHCAYIQVLADNYSLFARSTGKQRVIFNLLMELRRAINQAFRHEEDKAVTKDQLVQSNAKLVMLHEILPDLKERRHRVVLISHFIGMLDVVEQYLKMMDYAYARLDGTTDISKRKEQIDSFIAEDSDVFIMLLSARSAGDGLKLDCTDTVIMLDPDLNLTQQQKLYSRCFSLKHTEPTYVMHFVTMGSCEEGMVNMALATMDEQSGAAKSVSTEVLTEKIKQAAHFGARVLYHLPMPASDHRTQYDQQFLSDVLNREMFFNMYKPPSRSIKHSRPHDSDLMLLKHYKISTITPTQDADDRTFWARIVFEREHLNKPESGEGTGVRRAKRPKESVVSPALADVESPVEPAKPTRTRSTKPTSPAVSPKVASAKIELQETSTPPANSSDHVKNPSPDIEEVFPAPPATRNGKSSLAVTGTVTTTSKSSVTPMVLTRTALSKKTDSSKAGLATSPAAPPQVEIDVDLEDEQVDVKTSKPAVADDPVELCCHVNRKQLRCGFVATDHGYCLGHKVVVVASKAPLPAVARCEYEGCQWMATLDRKCILHARPLN